MAFCSLATLPVAGYEIGEARRFPFTMMETELVITRWLGSTGHEVRTKRPTDHRTDIVASKDEQSYRIELVPFSPLATEVRFQSAYGDPAEEEFRSRLFSHLSEQAHAAGSTPAARNHAVPTEILQRADAVVCIEVHSDGNSRQVSGFFVDDASGLVMCTAHDLKDAVDIDVIPYHGRKLPGEVIYRDTHLDLALIDIGVPVDAFIPLTESQNLMSIGDRVYAVGCPTNLRGTVTPGMVNSPPRRADGLAFWQLETQFAPGSSGSPVFNQTGDLVGVVKGRHREVDAIGFVIPVETIIEFVNQKPVQ